MTMVYLWQIDYLAVAHHLVLCIEHIFYLGFAAGRYRIPVVPFRVNFVLPVTYISGGRISIKRLVKCVEVLILAFVSAVSLELAVFES